MMYHTVADIRRFFVSKLVLGEFTSVNREASMTSLVGNCTVEIIGASFLADKETIFGEVNRDYLNREEAWYRSMSRNVNDIPGGAPAVWKAVASKDGTINSNYGWCVWSNENGGQFEKVVKELKQNPESRRAEIIYTRPSMWEEYNVDGRNDFMCTNNVSYVVRNGKVHAVVNMRSNDAYLGYRNDYAFQKLVLDEVGRDVGVPTGNIIWQVSSLHLYSRHFYLIDHYNCTGEITVPKSRYRELYPGSPYSA